MDSVPLIVSTRYNAKYTKTDLYKILVDAAVANTSPADRSRVIRDSGGDAPTGEWIRQRIEETCKQPMEDIFKNAMLKHLSELNRLGQFPHNPIIGIDRTYLSRYDKNNPDLIKGRAKDGTTTFEAHLTGQLVNAGKRIVISDFSVKKGDKNTDFVPKIVDLYETASNRPALFVLDRGFYSVAMIKFLNETRHTYVLPCVNTSGIKKAIEGYKRGERARVSKYVIKNSKDQAECYIIITRDRNDPEKYRAFATNDPKVDLEKYRSRWEIENGFKFTNKMRLRTHSRSTSCRMFMFQFPQMLLNLWTIFNLVLLVEGIASRTMYQSLFLKTVQTLIEIPPEPPPEPIAP